MTMAKNTIKRGLAALGTAAVLGAGALGIAHAQQTPTPKPPAAGTPQAQAQPGDRMEQFLSTLASKLGVSTDKLRQAIQETRSQLGYGPGFGFGGPHGRHGPGFGFGGPHGRHGFGFGGSLDTAASAIGISVDQLRQELPGKSLADVARAHNVDPSKVATALKNEAAARIDQAVAGGRLAADRAAQLKQEENTRIDQLMAQPWPAGGPGPRGGRAKPSTTATPSASATPGVPRSAGTAS
jgi:hypothetical protein